MKKNRKTRILFDPRGELALGMIDAEFREAYERNKDLLFRCAWRMTGSSEKAEDIVQESFLRLWRGAATYNPARGSLRSFLLGVTRNLALKEMSREREFDELEESAAVCGPLDPVNRERGEVVSEAVRALPPLQREAVIMAEYEEMSLEEIANVTGADLAAVKSRLHRGRQNLRRMLAPLLSSIGTPYGTR
jgi:RNA polymerase sigma-70 factor (ECF subfamily)